MTRLRAAFLGGLAATTLVVCRPAEFKFTADEDAGAATDAGSERTADATVDASSGDGSDAGAGAKMPCDAALCDDFERDDLLGGLWFDAGAADTMLSIGTAPWGGRALDIQRPLGAGAAWLSWPIPTEFIEARKIRFRFTMHRTAGPSVALVGIRFLDSVVTLEVNSSGDLVIVERVVGKADEASKTFVGPVNTKNRYLFEILQDFKMANVYIDDQPVQGVGAGLFKSNSQQAILVGDTQGKVVSPGDVWIDDVIVTFSN